MADWRSALEGMVRPGAGGVASAPGIVVAEKPCHVLVQVAAWAETLDAASAVLGRASGLSVPLRTGATASDSRHSILCVGPGRWLLTGAGVPHDRLRQSLPIEIAALTDLSHAFTVVRVSGARVLELMAKGPAIDFEAAFAPGSVARSTIHHMGVMILRPSADCFELFVDRGFARSLWHWAIDSAAEFGLRVEAPAQADGAMQL